MRRCVPTDRRLGLPGGYFAIGWAARVLWCGAFAAVSVVVAWLLLVVGCSLDTTLAVCATAAAIALTGRIPQRTVEAHEDMFGPRATPSLPWPTDGRRAQCGGMLCPFTAAPMSLLHHPATTRREARRATRTLRRRFQRHQRRLLRQRVLAARSAGMVDDCLRAAHAAAGCAGAGLLHRRGRCGGLQRGARPRLSLPARRERRAVRHRTWSIRVRVRTARRLRHPRRGRHGVGRPHGGLVGLTDDGRGRCWCTCAIVDRGRQTRPRTDAAMQRRAAAVLQHARCAKSYQADLPGRDLGEPDLAVRIPSPDATAACTRAAC